MTESTKAITDRKVYISYSTIDRVFVLKLAHGLEQYEIKPWVDFDLLPGTDFKEELDRRLKSSDIFLFVVSSNSLASPNCMRELGYAGALGKSIIPVMYQRVVDMPQDLSKLQWIDFSIEEYFEPALRKLVEVIRVLVPANAETATAQTGAQSSAPAAAQPSVRISLLRQNSTEPEEIEATHGLARLLARAARLQPKTGEKFEVSFSLLLFAFLAADDPLSKWFNRYVRDGKFPAEQFFKRRNLDRATLEPIAARPLTETELSTLDKPRLRTASVRQLFGYAESLRVDVSDKSKGADAVPLLDVRHLMAAYIYGSSGHESDIRELELNPQAWSNAFLGQMAKLHPSELDGWKEIHRRAFSSEPVLVEEIEGPSTHIATDMWTLKDTLGYRAYAYAISRFMTHKQTRPPLTISIQAPWGGGKTSLMRMIQHSLDPGALEDVKEEAGQPRGEFTVGQALKEIDDWISMNTQKALPPVPASADRKLLTVWFNAWKYESVNQVWAGLVDEIMHQVAARLSLKDRELFWLRLNLRRVDADKIRHRIHERIFRYWWRGMRYLLIGVGGIFLVFLLTALAGWLTTSGAALKAGWTGAALSVVGSALAAVLKYFGAKKEVEKEPAAVSLSEYLDIPNYSAEMGFIHRVEADLRRVLDSVPKQYYPIVIFIDDLDRCSPAKVGQVIEAVNLFLAGDFPKCMFVIGMDTEMVAAALQASHKEMISCLPADAGIPVGWRFMDKFVQLPFLIPPTEKDNLTRYTTALFAAQEAATEDETVNELVKQSADRVTTRVGVENESERLKNEHQLSETQVARVKDQLEAQVIRRKLDEGIEKFNDQNPEIREVITTATSYFRGNPRELKRFINAFRFQYFLWWAQRAQGLEVPALGQLLRWTVLSMKWPEVVRWLRRSGGNEWQAAPAQSAQGNAQKPALSTRLKLIEEISGKATDLAAWQKEALAVLRLKPETTPWLSDDDLLEFFHEEYNRHPQGKRLSAGLGKGLW